MLKWALFFFIVAVIAGLFGFSGIAGIAATIAQVLFVLSLVLFLGVVIAALFVSSKIID